jgi:hypothetical protein
MQMYMEISTPDTYLLEVCCYLSGCQVSMAVIGRLLRVARVADLATVNPNRRPYFYQIYILNMYAKFEIWIIPKDHYFLLWASKRPTFARGLW